MTDEIVMYDSPDVAKPVMVEAWKSRDGRIYLDEHSARYWGSTHVACSKCGTPAEKPYTACKPCRDLAEQAKYDALPRVEWDGEAMLYSETTGKYYRTLDDAADSLEDGQTLADLRLVVCRPIHVPELESDYLYGCLPDDDDDVPSEVERAMEAFNAAVKGIVLAWFPGKSALALPAEPEAT